MKDIFASPLYINFWLELMLLKLIPWFYWQPQLIVKYSKSCISITWFSWAVLRITLLSQETAKSPGRTKSRDPIDFLLLGQKLESQSACKLWNFHRQFCSQKISIFLELRMLTHFSTGTPFCIRLLNKIAELMSWLNHSITTAVCEYSRFLLLQLLFYNSLVSFIIFHNHQWQSGQ